MNLGTRGWTDKAGLATYRKLPWWEKREIARQVRQLRRKK